MLPGGGTDLAPYWSSLLIVILNRYYNLALAGCEGIFECICLSTPRNDPLLAIQAFTRMTESLTESIREKKKKRERRKHSKEKRLCAQSPSTVVLHTLQHAQKLVHHCYAL